MTNDLVFETGSRLLSRQPIALQVVQGLVDARRWAVRATMSFLRCTALLVEELGYDACIDVVAFEASFVPCFPPLRDIISLDQIDLFPAIAGSDLISKLLMLEEYPSGAVMAGRFHPDHRKSFCFGTKIVYPSKDLFVVTFVNSKPDGFR
jgi:hypothetical protein